jgi:hypothetical protein
MRGSLPHAPPDSQAIGANDPPLGHKRPANVPPKALTRQSRPTWPGRRHPNLEGRGHRAMLHNCVVLLKRAASRVS